MPVSLERTTDRLPAGFIQLEADAKTDGHGHLTRLSAEFAENPAMFHAIFVCYLDGELAGIGAITEEPARTSQPTWRMRWLYVHRKFRRQKVARTIAIALMQEVEEKVRMVTVHAGNDEGSQFWEAIGFRRVTGRSRPVSVVAALTWIAIWSAFLGVLLASTYHDLRLAKEGVFIDQFATTFD
jgi:GNAT superfamily N-acetyltransferase